MLLKASHSLVAHSFLHRYFSAVVWFCYWRTSVPWYLGMLSECRGETLLWGPNARYTTQVCLSHEGLVLISYPCLFVKAFLSFTKGNLIFSECQKRFWSKRASSVGMLPKWEMVAQFIFCSNSWNKLLLNEHTSQASQKNELLLPLIR
jgi:hypothetical protein